MDEEAEAVIVANALLDVPYADPDDDLRMLSRQLLRRHEELARKQYLLKALERATAILKAWADNDVVSDDTLMEMTDSVIPLCDTVLKASK